MILIIHTENTSCWINLSFYLLMLPIGYPFCSDNSSSYIFQKMFFILQISFFRYFKDVHIYLCVIFWGNVRNIAAVDFLTKCCIRIELLIWPDNSSFHLQLIQLLALCSSFVQICKMCILIVHVFCICEMPAITGSNFTHYIAHKVQICA